MNGIELSVIIVSYNCYDYLRKCLISLTEYNDIGDMLEIIVVDNGDDDTYIKVLNDNYKYVKVLKNSNNKGFGEGNNRGAEMASGKYLLFLNPDTELIMSIFKYSIEKFKKNNNIGCFGFQLLAANKKRGSSYGLRNQMGFYNEIIYKFCIRLNIFINTMMYTSGADLFIEKSIFKKVGGFDENIFMYCEESDLCNRVNALGKKVAFFNQKKIVHHEGKTQPFNLIKQYIKETESRKYYCEKYGINFGKEGRKELRYCLFKKYLFRLLGNNDKSNDYKNITEYWKQLLDG